MRESVATTQCSNSECQAANPLENQCCQKCGMPSIKRYLWALGDWTASFEVGQLIDERYLLKTDKIVLDTQPGVPPEFNEDIPNPIRTYLKLFPYRLHLPQIYTYYASSQPSPERVADEDESTDDEHDSVNLNIDICLLEYGTVPVDESGEPCYEDLLPQLIDVWSEAQNNPLRQLNWLWQMAQLWQPLEGQQMVSSLLDPFLVRTNGGIIQLLELRKDEHNYHSVRELGQFWLSLVEGASPLIADYLKSLCNYLRRGKIPHPEYLLTYFDPALTQCGQWYAQSYQIFTKTDAGPTREHNEDACYPTVEDTLEFTNDQPHFTLVCDGIGGQDGGEIASHLAIETLVEEIPKLSVLTDGWHSQKCLQELGDVIGLANNRISERNDSEFRQDRRRMGTTVVMTLVHGHEIYLAHVGDSRIYRITPHGCHQVTVDDDLASREVRLGYLFYRDAIKYPNAGALVQALGMSHSASLHPNVTRFMVDEDSVFLLCSDGLSDYDRVEQYWDCEITPIIRREREISTVGKTLIKLANQKNGHDNVTISLVYAQVRLTETKKTPLSMATVEQFLINHNEQDTQDTIEEPTEDTSPDLIPTEPLSSATVPVSTASRLSPVLVGILGILVVIFGAGIYGIWLLLKSPEPSPSIPTASPELSEPSQEFGENQTPFPANNTDEER